MRTETEPNGLPWLDDLSDPETHDLRHTCASLVLARNTSWRVVMEVLGHSQLSITTDLYSHVMPTALRDAASAMDRALGHRV